MKTKKWIPILTALIVPLMTGCGGDNGSTPANHAPVARAQSIVADEDTAKTFTLQGSDEDNDSLTYTLVTQPAHGALSGTAPNLTYTPAADWHGDDRFTFTVNDGNATSSAAEVNITVKPVNDAPVAEEQNISVDKDRATAIVLVGSDVDGDSITFEIVEHPEHGTLSGTAPAVVYTPDAGYEGVDRFAFHVHDGSADSPDAVVALNVVERPFRITVQTDNIGGSDNDAFTLTVNPDPAFSYNYRIDCNDDGTDEATGVSGNYTCDYSTLGGAGYYTVAIRGDFPAIWMPGRGDDALKIMTIEEWGTQKWQSFYEAFSRCKNMTMTATDTPNLSETEDLSYMFERAIRFNGAIGDWNVSSVKWMTGMFESALTFNQPLNNWDTSNVTNMDYMFVDAQSFNQPLNRWDTSHVVAMDSMFSDAVFFDQDISDWDISNVSSLRILDGTSFSREHYDRLLTKWSALPVQNDVDLSVPYELVSSESARPYRTQLIREHHWYIYDGNTRDDMDDDGATDDDEVRAGTDPADADAFVFRRKIYRAVTSTATGKKWLDRNLGADRVCTARDDSQCYGDYYQWGRVVPPGTATTTTQFSSINYIIFGNAFVTTHNDWVVAGRDNDGSRRAALWHNVEGRYTCPKHYRVPTKAEWEAETETGGNREDAYNSFLKLPSAGYRNKSDGSINQTGASGVTGLWSATPDGTEKAIVRAFRDSDALSSPVYRADGVPVRCIHE